MDIRYQTTLSFKRLIPRLEQHCAGLIRENPQVWKDFRTRLDLYFPDLFELLLGIYGNNYDFFFHLEDLMIKMADAWIQRPPDLKKLDAEREKEPSWFQSNHMLGGVCYVDLFAQNLKEIKEKIPYFKELGLTYIHLMPLFKCPEKENDGGYAVSSYREVNPDLGTMAELAGLSRELRQHGISLVLDFVFNHTSNEHEWAKKALEGDAAFQDYYLTYPDRTIPDQYERNLREIFPDEHPGAFTFSHQMNRWVWTTFHAYQWDLNYANPAVFNAMADELLFLANTGVEVLRLDAVAFIWKQMGTNCENLPNAHRLIQAFNRVIRIAAPALLFKSEAIVHPDEVKRYIHAQECQLSYNPLLMALLWNSLATRRVDLLKLALAERFAIPEGCAWVNYIRCHDDIGWTFSDEDAARLGINGFNHRKFLNEFYTGRFTGSFARGLPFQENPKTGDMRISGTCASLAGLEKAVREETANEVELAIRRIILLHSVILLIGGIPLIYLGDEIGVVNDYSYSLNPSKASDSRWVHRPQMDWEKAQKRTEPDSIEGKINQKIKTLVDIRKVNPVFSGKDVQVIETGLDSVLGFTHSHGAERVVIYANFSEQPQVIDANLNRLYGLSYEFTDLMTGAPCSQGGLFLDAYEVKILKAVYE